MRDRVQLVDASQIGAPEIRATVRRPEVEEVLRSKDGDPELVLDVARGGDAEPHTLRLAWERDELEALLRRAEGESLTLAFNGSQLEQVLEDDVAAHGLREAAVVLAVAATTAATGAGIAQASAAPAAPYASGGSATTAAATTGGVVSEREWPQVVPASPAPGGGAVSEREWPQMVGGTAESPAPAATHAAVVSEREWPQVVPASPARRRRRGQRARVAPDGRGTAAPTAAPVAGDNAIGADAATAAVVAGGVALLISGAAFTVRRQTRVQPKPV